MVSGSYKGVYKAPRALYTNLTHTFIYFETVCNIEENMSIHKENDIMARWHTYSKLGGSADFEVFYAHSEKNQKLLVRVARGKALLRLSR
jgi:hypothetical protein